MSRKLHLTRRELIAASAVTGASAAAVPDVWARKLLGRKARVGPGDFLHGVASGEPTSNAVTFWSRLETHRPRSGARLVVARDLGFNRVVATTIVPTGQGVNGALKARVGGLEPGTEYFYIWESGTALSEIGRTRTAPDPRAAGEPLRMAFSSCQHWPSGFYGAHQHAAGLADIDLYLFLGDYIYERSGSNVRRDPIDAVDLRSYRRKYGLYRTDPGLRELHRLHPTAHIWDDHEVVNNYPEEDAPPAAAQVAAAYRAAFEWLPRMTFPRDRHRIYKKLQFGGVADLFLLDERQYRTGRSDPARSMLGRGQLDWLIGELRASRATWKLVANQVVMAGRQEGEERASGDSWDGFASERARLLSELERAGIDNVVVLTGDAHVFMASHLASDFEAYAANPGRKPAAVEFVGGSVTSPGPDFPEEEIRDRAPWVEQYRGGEHGYTQMDLRPDRMDTVFLTVPVTDAAPNATIMQRFTQAPGTNRLQRS